MRATTAPPSSPTLPGQVPCLHDAASRAAWADFISDTAFQPSTRANYRGYALRFLRWLEPQGINLPDVSAQDVERFLTDQDLLPASKGMYRTGLRRLFDTLVAHRVVRTNPADETVWGEDAPTLAELKAAVRDLDPGAMDDCPEMLDAGVVLLAGLRLGTKNLSRLTRLTGAPRSRVRKFAERLRANGVWTPDEKTAARWDDDATGGIELIIDILIAMGMVERRPADGPEDRSNQDENVTIQKKEGA